jgi:hypothetical protein
MTEIMNSFDRKRLTFVPFLHKKDEEEVDRAELVRFIGIIDDVKD